MKRTGFMAAALAASITVACGGPDRNVNDNTTAVGTTGEARVDNADQEFVADMIAGNQAEIELGKLGMQKSSNADVRSIAQMLVNDHTKSLEKLKPIASAHNVSVEGPSEDDAELMNKLSNMDAQDFDREYLQALVDKHEETIDALEPRVDDAGTGTKEGPVRAEPDDNQLAAQANQWAAESLPTVRMHRDHAEQLLEKLNDRNRTN